MDLNNLVNKYQSIKIVPSIEESLQESGLDLHLNDVETASLNNLNLMWKTLKKSPAIEQNLELYFQANPDPYRFALAMVIKCQEFKDSKPKTLPFTIIEILQKWCSKHQLLPQDCHKLTAFQIAMKQRNPTFLSLTVKTYQLHTIKELIIPFVKDLMQMGNYKDACQIVMTLQMQDSIPVEELLFPMVLQDKSNVIDEYLKDCPSQIKPFLQFLDNLLDKNTSIQAFSQKYLSEHQINEVRYDKLHRKPLGKLLARLCSKFNIPIENCTNLSKNRTMGGLRYLVYKRYHENDVNPMVWDDLVKDSLKNNEESVFEFVNFLVDYDRNEALKWAKFFNLPKSNYPPGLDDMASSTSTQSSEDWDTDSKPLCVTQNFYKLILPREQIIIIDSGEKFYDMMNINLMKCKIASIDCEWKPSFGAMQSQVALIQISTNGTIYLLDAIVLNNKMFSSFWFSFCRTFLENAEIIKLGFGLEQDLKEIKASVQGLGGIKVKGEGLLDIALLWKALISRGLIVSGDASVGTSLSNLVEICFGLPLDKNEQCSNWELRPLRESQILYASLDSYVLLEIYYFLQKICEIQGLPFEEICNSVMTESRPKQIKKPKVAQTLKLSLSNSSIQTTQCNQLKLLVEPKLSGLLAYLIYCGIDASVIPTSMLWHDVINLAISDDKKVLVSKFKCSPTQNFSQDSIFEVKPGTIKEQLKQIFDYFKLDNPKPYLFQRCIYCNETTLKKLCENEVQQLCEDYEKSSSSFREYDPNEVGDDYDDNCDRFLDDSDEDNNLYQVVQRPVNKCVSVTVKGAPIDNIAELINQNKDNVTLCESCGKLLWQEEELMKKVINVVNGLCT